MERRILALLFITNFVNVLGFTIVFPLLPFFAKEFGASPFQIALLFASFPLMQFIFSPFWGKISDSIGRKPVIIFSLLGSSISFFLFGLAGSFIALFIIRTLHGITSSAGFPSVQAAGADISKKEERAKVMGILGSAFSLAIMFGPAASGILSTISIQFSFFVAAVVAFIDLIFVFLLVPETNKKKSKKISFSGSFVLPRVWQSLRGNLAPVYLIYSVSFLSFSIMGVAFPLFALDRFGFGPLEVGYFFAALGAVGVVVQSLIVGRMVEKFGEPAVVKAGLGFMLLSCLLISFIFQPILAAVVLSLMAVGTSLINPANNSLISKRSKNQGIALGTLNSFGSISRFTGPLVVGTIYQVFGPTATFLVTALIVFLGLLLSLKIE
jgi:multidrug resistance protein